MAELQIESAHIGPCTNSRGQVRIMHLVNVNGVCMDCGYCPPIRVNWKHIDGPMMTRPDGTLKWLTFRERFMHWIGRWSLEDIARRPSL